MGEPTGSPGKLERAALPQYGPFPASPCRRSVNQKRREFVVGLFGSANMAKFEARLMRGPDGTRWHAPTNSPPNISNGFNWLRCRVVRIVATCPDRGEQTTKMLTETGWGGNVTLYAILGLWLALVQERKQRRLGRGQLRSVGERNQRRVQSDAVTPQGECG